MINNLNTNYESPIMMGDNLRNQGDEVAIGMEMSDKFVATTNLQSPNYLFNPLLSNQKIGPYEMFKSPP